MAMQNRIELHESRKSKGHQCFDGGVEWYEREGNLYRAPVHNAIDVDGYRHGRWECTIEHARRFPDLFPFIL